MAAVSTWHPSLGPPPAVPAVRARVRRRNRGRWLAFASGAAAVALLMLWVTNSRLFDLAHLDVRGTSILTSQRVADMAGVGRETNLLWTSTGELRARLESDPWVASATVSRTLPGSLKITIKERVPAAVVAGTTTIVASDGVVLGAYPIPGLPPLPELVVRDASLAPGQRLPLALPHLSVAAAMPAEVGDSVAQILLTDDGVVTVRLADGARAVFGDAHRTGEKWAALKALLSWTARKGVTPGWIDLREPSAPALRPAKGSGDSPGR
jgi:cell division septal protein FtsQ